MGCSIGSRGTSAQRGSKGTRKGELMKLRQLSRRALRAATIFGITPAQVARPCRRDAAAGLDAALQPGQLALIVGPSGGGKSSIARELARLIWSRQGGVIIVE